MWSPKKIANEQGQGLNEYALVLSLVAFIGLLLLIAYGNEVYLLYCDIMGDLLKSPCGSGSGSVLTPNIRKTVSYVSSNREALAVIGISSIVIFLARKDVKNALLFSKDVVEIGGPLIGRATRKVLFAAVNAPINVTRKLYTGSWKIPKGKASPKEVFPQEKIQNAVDAVFELLAKDARYQDLSKYSGKKQTLGVKFLKDMAWNLVSGVMIGVVSNYIYARLNERNRGVVNKRNQELKRELQMMERKLESANRKLLSKKECIKSMRKTYQLLQYEQTLPNDLYIVEISAQDIQHFLKKHGWPESISREEAEKIISEIRKAMNFVDDEE